MNIYGSIDYLKTKIKIAIDKGRYENALEYISLAADILYNYNQYYYDKELENFIKEISNKIFDEKNLDDLHEDIAIFYDGFGLDNRGLAQIYILGLCKFKKIIYITDEKHKNNIPTIKSILKKNSAISYFIPEGSKLKKIEFVKTIIEHSKPQNIFMYAYPNDVIITTVLYHYEAKIIRYQINLTDHAFWLGSQCIDYCIEFRDYGAYLSNVYRSIAKSKLILLPYYPIVDKSVEFQGYPFNFNKETQKIVFSGGALYKTFGGEDKYYVIVDYILNKYNNIIFWYAGTGDRSKFDLLEKRYPNRIFVTNERKDLYQVLKHCCFYLSTYPFCGGLMFQYAAVAEKLPLTLKYDECTDGFLINQEKLDIEFYSLNRLKEKIDKVLLDSQYLSNEEIKIKKSVITQKDFDENLKMILDRQRTTYNISFRPVDTTNVRREIAENMTFIKLCDIVAGHRKLCVIKLMPKEFLIGIFFKIKRKLKNKLGGL